MCIVTIYCCLYDCKPHSVLDRLKERFHRVLDVIYGLHVCDYTLCNYVFNYWNWFFSPIFLLYSPSFSFAVWFRFTRSTIFILLPMSHFTNIFFLSRFFFYLTVSVISSKWDSHFFYKYSYLNSNYRMNVRNNYFMTVQKVLIFCDWNNKKPINCRV